MTQADDEELRILIQKVSRRIRANRSGDRLSDSRLSVLFHLASNGVHTPGELADHERVTPPSMNRTLNALEEQGLIARLPSDSDARKVRVELTDAGAELITETRRLRTAWFSQQIAGLTADERRLLRDATPILRRLAES